MLILETGEYGIQRMNNTHTNNLRKKIVVYKGMDLTGVISVSENIVNLGYNEIITCETDVQAGYLFYKIAEEL